MKKTFMLLFFVAAIFGASLSIAGDEIEMNRALLKGATFTHRIYYSPSTMEGRSFYDHSGIDQLPYNEVTSNPNGEGAYVLQLKIKLANGKHLQRFERSGYEDQLFDALRDFSKDFNAIQSNLLEYLGVDLVTREPVCVQKYIVARVSDGKISTITEWEKRDREVPCSEGHVLPL